MEKFDAHKRTIKEALSYIYEVPFYQRGYSWEKDQVSQFWDDLMMVIEDDCSEYFLGTIVLNTENKKRIQIIDGQQRLSTITIFCCAVRDLLLENGQGEFNETAQTIHGMCISEKGIMGGNKYKLTLSEVNKEFFQSYIQMEYGKEEKKGESDFENISKKKRRKSNQLIWEAYIFFKDRLAEFADGNLRVIAGLLEKIINSLLVISIEVNSDTDAYIIFETLNDRGLDLTTADLLKNYLFSKVDKHEVQDMQQKWIEITSILNNNSVTNFLRCFWIAKYERVTDKKLYEKIKIHINKNCIEIHSFIEELSKCSEIYVNIIEPTLDIWKNKDIVNCINRINLLNYKSIYPLILISKLRLNDENIKLILNKVESYIFRRLTVCGHSPSDVDKELNSVVQQIRKDGDKAIDSVLEILQKTMPDDDVFIRIFENISIDRQKTQRYILERIENSRRTGELISNSSEQVHIEHIMPKNPNRYWKEELEKMLGEDEEFTSRHEEYINKLGNLTLLGRKLNESASNKRFDVKKSDYYCASEFKITKELLDYDKWDFDKMKSRQIQMAKEAAKIWSI